MAKFNPAIQNQPPAVESGDRELMHKVYSASRKRSKTGSPFEWVSLTEVHREYIPGAELSLAELEARLRGPIERGYAHRVRHIFKLTPAGHSLVHPDGFSGEGRRVLSCNHRYHANVSYFGGPNY